MFKKIKKTINKIKDIDLNTFGSLLEFFKKVYIKGFKRDFNPIFLHKVDDFKKNTLSISTQRKNDFCIILSPLHYWLKVLKAPFRFNFEAMKVAPSLFEDIDYSGNFEYKIKKAKDGFYVIAYDKGEIKKILSEAQDKSIKNAPILFAQFEFFDSEKIFKLNDYESLACINGIVSPVLNIHLKENQVKGFLDKGYKPVSSPVYMSKSSDFLSKKDTIFVSALMIIMLALNFSSIFFLKQKTKGVVSEKNLIISDSGISPISYVRDSILSNLEKKDDVERRKRDFLQNISQINLINTPLEYELNIDSSGILLEIFSVSSENAESFKSKILEKVPDANITFQNNTLSIRVKYA